MESCETSINCHCPPFFCFARIGAAYAPEQKAAGDGGRSAGGGAYPHQREAFPRLKNRFGGVSGRRNLPYAFSFCVSDIFPHRKRRAVHRPHITHTPFRNRAHAVYAHK